MTKTELEAKVNELEAALIELTAKCIQIAESHGEVKQNVASLNSVVFHGGSGLA